MQHVMQFLRVPLLLLMLAGLAACDSPSTIGNADAEGRMRLSINKSYGDFGDFVVHINALNTAALTPGVAQAINISRSEQEGLVNLVVLKKTTGLEGTDPVQADVKLKAANLTGQVKTVDVREVIDSESIYYIGVVSFDDEETINFDFDITPEGSTRKLAVRYSHTFYEG